MNVTLERLRRDYLALLGESPGLSPVLEEGEESGVLILEEALRARLLPLAIEATLETPELWLDDIERSDPAVSWRGSTATLRLPSDYLRFYLLEMPGWDAPVTSLEPPGSLRARLGTRCPDWMACAKNPLVMEGRDHEGKFLTVKGVEGHPDTPELLLYVPMPRLTDKKLKISGAAYPLLLDKLIASVDR